MKTIFTVFLLIHLVLSFRLWSTTDEIIKYQNEIRKTYTSQLEQQKTKFQRKLDPIIFVPGFGGNQLEMKLVDADPPRWYCLSNSDWYQIWISVFHMLPFLKVFYFNFTNNP